MLFALAFMWENFPKYDKVEQTRRGNQYRNTYYHKGVEVYCEEVHPYVVIREHFIGLRFIEAENVPEATNKLFEEYPFHIIQITVSPIPARKEGKLKRLWICDDCQICSEEPAICPNCKKPMKEKIVTVVKLTKKDTQPNLQENK